MDRVVVRLEATVRGRVQGVGFRYFVLRQAKMLGLSGWVSNESDGTVRTVAEGSEAAIDRFQDALTEGPPGAIVDDIRAVRMPGSGTFDGFSVRSAGHSGD